MSFFVTPYVDEYGDTTYNLTSAGYTGLIILFIALLLLGAAIFGNKKKMSTKQLVFSAMAIALATVTSMIKLFEMPMGGSVTLFSMLFIVLIGYWYGLGGGLTVAIAYGVLQLLLDPYILSFPQMLVDYILAFGALGLAGIFHNSKHGLIKGYIVAVLGRYFFAFLSGWIFFGMYAPEGQNVLVYAAVYNGLYLVPEAIICIALAMVPQIRQLAKRLSLQA